MHDPMAIILISSQNRIWNTGDVIGELIFSNQSRYSWQQLAYRICRWLWAQHQIYHFPKLDVYCDRSNLTFIEMVNTEAKKQRLSWLYFYSVPQIEILFRICFKQGLMGANKLNISLNIVHFLLELTTATWDKKNPEKPRLMRGIPDHAMDGFDYAMVSWYNYFITKVNPHWFKRGR